MCGKWIFFYLGLSFFISGCMLNSKKLFSGQLTNEERKLLFKMPSHFDYKKVKGVFYYEQYIGSYIEADAIVKKGNYIYSNNKVIDLNTYISGYYIMDRQTLYQWQLHDSLFKCDLNSIDSFLKQRESLDLNITLQTLGINPYCNMFYRKIYFEAEVIDLGMQFNRIPIFYKDCKEYNKRRRKNYDILKLHTYVFTHIIRWKEQ